MTQYEIGKDVQDLQGRVEAIEKALRLRESEGGERARTSALSPAAKEFRLTSPPDPAVMTVEEWETDATAYPDRQIYRKFRVPNEHAFQWKETKDLWEYHGEVGYNGPAGSDRVAPSSYYIWNRDTPIYEGCIAAERVINGTSYGWRYEERFDESKGGNSWYINNFGGELVLTWYINDSLRFEHYADNRGVMRHSLKITPISELLRLENE